MIISSNFEAYLNGTTIMYISSHLVFKFLELEESISRRMLHVSPRAIFCFRIRCYFWVSNERIVFAEKISDDKLICPSFLLNYSIGALNYC